MSVHIRLRRAAVPFTVAGLLVAAMITTTAAVADSGDSTTIGINGGNVPTTAEQHGDHSCDQVPSAGENEDGWVFVLPGNKWRFVSVTATFTAPDGGTHTREGVKVKGPSESATSKFYIVTSAGWQLTDAIATVEPKNGDHPGKAPKKFNLTHTCPGTPDEPEPEPSSPTPSQQTPTSDIPSSESPSGQSPSSPDTSSSASASPSTTDAAGDTDTDTGSKPDDTGSLATTGLSLTLPLLLGLVLVAAGTATVIWARRRRILASWDDAAG